MRRPFLVLVLLAFAATTLPQPAASAAFGCAALAPAPVVPTGLAVPPPYPNHLLGPCPGGQLFVSATPPCPLNAAPIALPGEYCGAVPGFPPGATIVCTGTVATPNTKYDALVIGLDFAPYDGHVLPPEPLTYEGILPAFVHSAKIANPGPGFARVIAYPVNVVDPGPILVNCV